MDTEEQPLKKRKWTETEEQKQFQSETFYYNHERWSYDSWLETIAEPVRKETLHTELIPLPPAALRDITEYLEEYLDKLMYGRYIPGSGTVVAFKDITPLSKTGRLNGDEPYTWVQVQTKCLCYNPTPGSEIGMLARVLKIGIHIYIYIYYYYYYLCYYC